MANSMRVIGLMSGTSYDAIDAAAAELSIHQDRLLLRPLGTLSVAMPDHIRRLLDEIMPPASTTLAQVCQLDTELGKAFADVAVHARRALCGDKADAVASHGQTVFHWIDDGKALGTLQLGQPAWIAERTGLPVVADFRPRDIAAGGQGAPLVSIMDVLLLAGTNRVRAALNLGGIANLTVVPPEGPALAFDTGPANALIDVAVRHFTNGAQRCDDNGALATRGHVVPALLDRLLAEPYYRRTPPKTTGKELFHLPYLLDALAGFDSLTLPDVAATLTELTARTVADAARGHGVSEVIASGGGTLNPALLAALATQLSDTPIIICDELGIPSSGKEAYAFAVLGFLTLQGVPGTIASCTGARQATVLGHVTPGATPLRLPDGPPSPPTKLVIVKA